jgi:hypothetical protein
MAGWQAFAVGTIAVGCAFAVTSMAGAAGPAAGWTTFSPKHAPVTIQLPDSWKVVAAGNPDEVFRALATNGTYLDIYAKPEGSLTWSAYIKAEYSAVRKHYVSLDAKASVQTRTVSLPSGAAFEVIARYTQRNGSHSYPQYVRNYNILRKGTGYDFQYVASSQLAASEVPVFTTSARSIAFNAG